LLAPFGASAWSRWLRCPLEIRAPAAVTVAAVLSAGIVAALGGHHLPWPAQAADSRSGIADPLGAASALWDGLTESHAFLLETIALAARRRPSEPSDGAAPGAARCSAPLLTLTLLVAPAAAALPLVAPPGERAAARLRARTAPAAACGSRSCAANSAP
jgi:hypothetical protein